jgi:hypothetical protein
MFISASLAETQLLDDDQNEYRSKPMEMTLTNLVESKRLGLDELILADVDRVSEKAFRQPQPYDE